MKKISIILLVFATMLGFYSCQKEAPKVVYNPANVKAPTLSGITDGSVLTFHKSQSDSVVKITWTPAEYGFKASVQYFLQIAKAGTNFAEPQSLGTTEGVNSLNVAVSNFNNKVNTMKANPESTAPVDVEMRLVSIINPNVDTVFSQTIGFTLNTYYIPIVYPQLYVPGAYQGWAPDAADSIGSVKSNSKFEGYIYFDQATEFKFTSQRDWNGTNYGDGGSAGTLSTDAGAGNLSVAEAGFYKLNVDTQALTWSSLKTTWSIIGSITAGGDWSTDDEMTFDPATGLWSVTGDFPAGEFKFRANDAWDLNYGSLNNDGILDQKDGNNIVLDAAGNYTITLDLTNTVYKYSIKKN